MNIVLILIPITLLLVTAGILLFNWAVKNGQYDDLEGPAHRILYDDDRDMIPDDAKQPRDVARAETGRTVDQDERNEPKA
ncbi:cbb3-type cytochrome oxidase assembly protein CcoS [Marinobacter sp. LN3S78]|uniref:cbb3-type cytochrome oxidase assembly protein CcoS n=1 Tax=Marinobacter sp. LN3S78 TaxID=3382300 RepID=UPI00387B5334